MLSIFLAKEYAPVLQSNKSEFRWLRPVCENPRKRYGDVYGMYDKGFVRLKIVGYAVFRALFARASQFA